MEMKFCRRCGQTLKKVNKHTYRCSNSHTIYSNSSPSLGIFLINGKSEVVLSVRGIEPRKGMLDSFGGFLDSSETFEDALARELKEELDLDPSDYSTPEYLTSGIGNYPYGGEVIPVVSTFYWASLLTDKPLLPQDDVADIFTAKIEEVDLSQLHDDDVRNGLIALQNILPTLHINK